MQKRLNAVTGREMNNNGGGTGNEIWNGGSGGRRHLKHRSNALLHNTRRKITASPSLRRRLWRHSETSETLWGQFEDKAVMTGFKERETELFAVNFGTECDIHPPSPIPLARFANNLGCGGGRSDHATREWARADADGPTNNRRANKRNYHLIDSVCRPSLTR